MIVYSYHDVLSETYFYPQVAVNAEVAKRDYARACQNPNFPKADIEVVKIGTWNDSTGVIAGCDHEVLVPRPESESVR